MNCRYIIVTPVKNEQHFLRTTIAAVARQSCKPEAWYIVDDSSTDATPEIIAQASREHSWIKGVKAVSGGTRRIGGQAALYPTLSTLDARDYDFILRMDGDLDFGEDTLTRLFAEFDKNPKLGVASGTCFITVNGRKIQEKHPRFHTRGPLKVYRSACYQAMQGLDPNEGWDTIDELKANQLGWQSSSFPDIQLHHLRKTQTASGALRGYLNMGRVSFYVGYHPVYALVRSVRHFFSTPWGLGGLYMMFGFFEGYAKRASRIEDRELIGYLRQQQMNRLLGRATIWH
jgi:glycosyltransferase involved in cell wall biosynthesis